MREKNWSHFHPDQKGSLINNEFHKNAGLLFGLNATVAS